MKGRMSYRFFTRPIGSHLKRGMVCSWAPGPYGTPQEGGLMAAPGPRRESGDIERRPMYTLGVCV